MGRLARAGSADRLAKGETFRRASAVRWKCLNCGYVAEGKEAPKLCPACQHPQAYYVPWTDQTY